jgi:hypothetical protein
VPELPEFDTEHIDKTEQALLATEFMDWFLTGNRTGKLLRRKALSVEAERDYRKAKADLRQARASRKKHHRKAPADQEDKRAMSIWEREDARLAQKIEDLEYRIQDADRNRARRKTILQHLDAVEASRGRIRKFRTETARAAHAGKRLVFSLLSAGDGGAFCKYLDRAFSTGSDRGCQGVQWLRRASFLLNAEAAEAIRDNRVQCFGSIT